MGDDEDVAAGAWPRQAQPRQLPLQLRLDAQANDVALAVAIEGLRARMLLQVHDELIFEVPEAEVDATIDTVVSVMEKATLPALSLSVPLKVDARAADNWDEAH